MLYNRPVSLGVAYFIINLKESASRTDGEAAGFLKHKPKSKIEENEEAIKKGDVSEPTDYEWMFKVFRSRYQEPAGSPVMRIAKQLNDIEAVIFRE